jgi:hypothetical protein
MSTSTGGYPVPNNSSEGGGNGSTNSADTDTNAGPMNQMTGNNGSTTTPTMTTSTSGASQTTGTNNATTGSTNGMTAGPQFDQMFVAVADFMREKCIACHSEGQNGNFQIASADATNEEVRVALEDVEATTGNLMVEPFDPDASQVYIMITNDAGEQFEPDTIAIVEDWINAGAPYVPE